MITFDTLLNADCVECSPDGLLIAVGCYELDEMAKKSGGVYFFNQSLASKPTFVATDAVLDMKWRGEDLLIATNSRGLEVLRADITPSYDARNCEDVHLSLDYNTEQIYASTNSGNVLIYDHSLNPISHLNVHDLETWTVCADGPSVIYTGADDALMKGWDVRSNECLFVKKQHSAGVCSIVCLDDNRIASGSYDKNLRVWDKRTMGRPLSSVQVDSGVWRLKRMSSGRILAACMHDGFYVFDCDSSSNAITMAQHEKVKGLSYGCSFDPTEKIAFTCCFYQRQVQQWHIN